jgi:hypothetical protein
MTEFPQREGYKLTFNREGLPKYTKIKSQE